MKEKLKSGLGVFIKSPNIETIECCGMVGMDFIVIDMEHTPIGPRDLYPLVLASENQNLKLVVRLPNLNEEYFKWCLDMGITNLQVPQIESVDDVNRVLKNSYFSPLGERGLCRFVRSANFSSTDKGDYIVNSNDKINLILQIEGVKGFENLDAIIDHENVNTIFIGPYDLSQSLGHPGDIWNPLVTDTMKKIIDNCKDKSVDVGVFTDTIKGLKYWLDLDVDFIEYGSDMMLLSKSLTELKNELNSTPLNLSPCA